MSTSIQIRGILPEDWIGIDEVQRATYNDHAMDTQIYQWWSKGLDPHNPGGVVALVSGRIVGVQPMQFFPYRAGSTFLVGAMLTGVAVHPDFRRQGIFGRFIDTCEQNAWERGASFVVTLPNERSKPGFLKRGYSDLGSRTLLMAPTIFKPQKNPQNAAVAEVDRCSESWVALFSGYEGAHGKLCMHRSNTWLNWRYHERPPGPEPYRFFEYRRENGRVSAVAVVVCDRRKKLPITYILDMACENGAEMGVLLKYIKHSLRREGLPVVAAVVSSLQTKSLIQKAGFRILPGWLPLKTFHTVAKPNPDLPIEISFEAVSDWEWALGDWDNL